MSNQQKLTPGDRVEWPSGSGKAEGTVQKRITQDQTVDGNAVSASKEAPRYLVENENTGKVTGHRPETLAEGGDRSGNDDSGQSSDPFQPGDKVEWNSPQGQVQGTVQRKLTSETQIKGHKVKASDDEPQYLVESDSTGAEAAHKPDALNRR